MAVIWNRLNTLLLVFVLLALVAVLGVPARGVRSGPLDPPLAPGPTNAQIEPRMPIPPVGWDAAFPITIGQRGSYYLTQSIDVPAGQDGVVVAASNVTLDLNGFAIQGGDSGTGIKVTKNVNIGPPCNVAPFQSRWGITIRDGEVRRFATGIDAECAAFSRIQAVRSEGNADFGMKGGEATVIQDCHSNGNGTGVEIGFRGTVRECNISFNFQGNGIVAFDEAVVTGNVIEGNATSGALSGAVLLGDNVVLRGNEFRNGVDAGVSRDVRVENTTGHVFVDNVFACASYVTVVGGGTFAAQGNVIGGC